MPAKRKPSSSNSTAAIGFEAAALRGSAFPQSEAKPQVVSEAKDNMAGFVLANGSMGFSSS